MKEVKSQMYLIKNNITYTNSSIYKCIRSFI